MVVILKFQFYIEMTVENCYVIDMFFFSIKLYNAIQYMICNSFLLFNIEFLKWAKFY